MERMRKAVLHHRKFGKGGWKRRSTAVKAQKRRQGAAGRSKQGVRSGNQGWLLTEGGDHGGKKKGSSQVRRKEQKKRVLGVGPPNKKLQ